MPHCIILGVGIIGLTAGLELRTRGWEVTLVDPGPVPHPRAASTDVSKVIRLDYGADDLYTSMAEEAIAGWHTWNAGASPPVYHEDGFLVLSTEPMAPGTFEYESFQTLSARGYPLTRLGDLHRASLFPAWSAQRYPDGYFNARGGWAESGAVVARLASHARARGVRIQEGTRAHELLDRRGGVVGVRTAERVLTADCVLVAAGAWTPALLPELADVMWATGQPVVHVDVGAELERWRAPHFPVWAADIARTGWYGFPALADGSLKIGHHGPGRRVHADEERVVLESEVDRARQFLRDNLPPLADAPVRHTRLCLYCDTFDGDFWIDHHPDRPGLVVAAGDSGHGFKFAPVLGALVADVVERRPNPWAGRFRWRARDRNAREAARSGA